MANTVSVWNTDTSDLVHAFPGHRGGVTRSIDVFPDNATLASGGADGTVKLWNVSPPKKSALRIASEEHPLWYLQYSPDGRTLATSGPDGIVRLFEADTGDFIQSLAPLAPRRGRASNRAWTHQLSFSPDGRMLGAGNGDHTATVYSVDSGRPQFVLDGHISPLINIRFAPNGRTIATTGEDDVVVLWDAGSGRELQRVEGPRFVEFQPDPRSRILALGERQGVSLLDIDTGERHSVDVNSPWSLTFLDSGRTLAVGLESEIRLYSDGQHFVWSEHSQSEPVFDFVRIYTDELTRVDPAMDWSVVYGVCYLECERPFENLQARIGSDDQAVLYLNGAEIHRHTVPRGHELDQDVVDGIRMNQGLNRLVFKVVNEEYHWAGSVRFTDAQGRPVSGIRARLSPRGQFE